MEPPPPPEKGAGDDYPVEAVTRALTEEDLRIWLRKRATLYFQAAHRMNYLLTGPDEAKINDFISFA